MNRARLCAIGDEAGIQLNEQLDAVRACGLSAIELRSIGGAGIEWLDRAEVRAAAASVRAAGLTVPVVDTPIGGWSTNVLGDMRLERQLLRRAAEHAREFGCSRLRVMSYPNCGLGPRAWRDGALRRMDLLAAEAATLEVTLLHENCCGWAAGDAERTVELLERVGSDRLRVLFDTGNGLEYGYSAREYLEVTLPWVEHVHLKDGRHSRGGKLSWQPPGAGQAELVECVELLVRAGYDGWYSVEPHLVHVPHASQHQSGTRGEREDAARRAQALTVCVEALERMSALVWSAK